MTTNVLKIISDTMTLLGVEYGFAEYTSNPIVYPYFVGEYQESEPLTEDGLQEATFILDGFSRDTWLTLEEAKEKIEDYFTCFGRAFTREGSTAVIGYANSFVVPTGDAELKRIQINLFVKEWKVNI